MTNQQQRLIETEEVLDLMHRILGDAYRRNKVQGERKLIFIVDRVTYVKLRQTEIPSAIYVVGTPDGITMKVFGIKVMQSDHSGEPVRLVSEL